MTLFIGMHAPKRTGKDTFARHLKSMIEELTFPYHKVVYISRMARPLYVWAEAVTGWKTERLMGAEKDTAWTAKTAPCKNLIGHSPRSLLLDLGLWAKEKYGEDFLANTLRGRFWKGHVDFVLVPDIRNDVEGKTMDLVFDLHREGFQFEGGRTESPLSIPMTTIVLKTCEDTSQAADYRAIATQLLIQAQKEPL